jgi:hypothetical protein
MVRIDESAAGGREVDIAAAGCDESQAVPRRVQGLGEGAGDWEGGVSTGGKLPVVRGLTVGAADAAADDDDGDAGHGGFGWIHGRPLETDMAYM